MKTMNMRIATTRWTSFANGIESAGFTILEARDDLYLGDDDFVVARK
jgi:hypothetical protein